MGTTFSYSIQLISYLGRPYVIFHMDGERKEGSQLTPHRNTRIKQSVSLFIDLDRRSTPLSSSMNMGLGLIHRGSTTGYLLLIFQRFRHPLDQPTGCSSNITHLTTYSAISLLLSPFLYRSTNCNTRTLLRAGGTRVQATSTNAMQPFFENSTPDMQGNVEQP